MKASRCSIQMSRSLGPVWVPRMIEPGWTAVRTEATMPAGLSLKTTLHGLCVPEHRGELLLGCSQQG